jgi:hypothetical protein
VDPIICDVVMTDLTLPKMPLMIKRSGDVYNCLYSDWKNGIRIKQFYHTFLHDNRDGKYAFIEDDTRIVSAQEGEGGPYMVLCIRARAPVENERRKR